MRKIICLPDNCGLCYFVFQQLIATSRLNKILNINKIKKCSIYKTTSVRTSIGFSKNSRNYCRWEPRQHTRWSCSSPKSLARSNFRPLVFSNTIYLYYAGIFTVVYVCVKEKTTKTHIHARSRIGINQRRNFTCRSAAQSELTDERAKNCTPRSMI